ncbi:MAG: two-component sensor histidine kinase [Gammaproteobacteria bacterium]|nr:two-component sensor histidine kinase [Gammaproteobacteria bacterium]MDE2350001.1 two-component sensor histidine kinase [Gammaproteobacteria bacterium]
MILAIDRRSAPSLQRRLWVSISVVIAATALIGALIAFVTAFMEGEEQQDSTLQQMAALADRAPTVDSMVLKPRGEDEDVDTSIVVTPLDRIMRPAHIASAAAGRLRIPAGLADGFHEITSRGDTWRVFVNHGRSGRIAVAQEASFRLDAAFDGAVTALLPALALLPMLLFLIDCGISRALAPLRSIATALDAGQSATLAPLPLAGVPREVRPFLTSINELLERVSCLLSRERRFIADAAHELRTPIAVLRLQTDNLGSTDLPAIARTRLRDLQTGVDRMRSTVEQLLTLARIQHHEVEEMPVIDAGAVLECAVKEQQAAAWARRIEISVHRHGGSSIAADEFQLYTLLRNAIDNALRHSPEGSRVTATVDRARRVDGVDEVVLEICDSGPGIPEADLDRAFLPFERLQAGGQSVGSGLGLTIMSGAAANLGGTLRLSNQPAGGLCVRYSQRAAPPGAG